MTSTPLSPAERLKEQLNSSDFLTVALGVWDGISARTAMEFNPPALYMSGALTSASMIGQPDLGIANQEHFIQNVNTLTDIAGNTPVIADMDTGFGSVLNIRRTVQMYERAGVAAFHIEDQVMPKRCGHLRGKEVVSREEWIARLKATLAARSGRPSQPLVIARTDALQTHGLDEAIERIKLAAELGVDAGFVEAVRTREEAERVVRELAPLPLVLNLPPNGATPSFTNVEAKAMGFQITWHLSAAFGVVAALRRAYGDVMTKGTDVANAENLSPRQLFKVMGLDEVIEFEAACTGGKLYSKT